MVYQNFKTQNTILVQRIILAHFELMLQIIIGLTIIILNVKDWIEACKQIDSNHSSALKNDCQSIFKKNQISVFLVFLKK